MTQIFEKSFLQNAVKYGLPNPLIVQETKDAGTGFCFQFIAQEYGMFVVSSGAFRVGTTTTARMVRTRARKFAPEMGKLLVDVVDGVAVISYYRNIPSQFGYNKHTRDKAFRDFIGQSFLITKDITERTKQIMEKKGKEGQKGGR